MTQAKPSTLRFDLRQESSFVYFHGCIKPGFPTDKYCSIDQKNHLKWHVFEKNVRGVLRYVFGISVTYDFDTIVLLDRPEALSCFRYRLFCIKGIF